MSPVKTKKKKKKTYKKEENLIKNETVIQLLYTPKKTKK